MLNSELYELSTQTNALAMQCKSLLGFHTCRYKHFVDGSDRGFNCTYARMTSRYAHEELTEMRAALKELQSRVQVALDTLDAASTVTDVASMDI